jgi:phage regulator Rha-like protein
MSNIINTNALMMSSREIAELTGKAHAHVMRDIRSMMDALEQNPELDSVCKTITYTGSNGQNYDQYELDKDTCLTLLLGYDPVARMKVVKRWQALESGTVALPQTLPEALRLAAEAIEDRDRLALENKAKDEALAEAAPKVRALDRIASPTEGAVCLRIAAKLLQMPEKQFFQFANAEGYIFRHHHSRVWQGYAEKAKAGLVEQKFTTVTRDDGSEKTVEQVLITRLGIAKLAEKLERRNQCAAMIATGSMGGQSKHSPMQR